VRTKTTSSQDFAFRRTELFDERKISPERRVELIRLAIKSMDYTQVLDVSEFLDAATFYGMVAVVSPKGVVKEVAKRDKGL
jgi:hypothetical protein